MDSIPLSTLVLVLAILLVVSGLFSLAETTMMAANRVRLRHRAHRGSGGARRALALLAQTDKLLGVLLLGNNLLNAACATLTAVLAARLFGEGRIVLALGTLAITFLILVFSEITPKVIGATHADVSGDVRERWNLPPIIQRAVACHHEPDAADAGRPHLSHMVDAANPLALHVFTVFQRATGMRQPKRHRATVGESHVRPRTTVSGVEASPRCPRR